MFGPEANLLYVATDPLGGTAQTAVIVVDAVDGTVVVSPLLLEGHMGGTHKFSVSPDRTRVFQTLSGEGGTTVAVVGADGGLIATTVPITGYAATPVEFSPDGSRAYQATRGTETIVSAIDTTTGRVIGSPVIVKGDYGDQLFVADGGNRVDNTTTVTLLEFCYRSSLFPFFSLYFGVGMSSVYAIDATAF